MITRNRIHLSRAVEDVTPAALHHRDRNVLAALVLMVIVGLCAILALSDASTRASDAEREVMNYRAERLWAIQHPPCGQ